MILKDCCCCRSPGPAHPGDQAPARRGSASPGLDSSQGHGYATEAVDACVEWALAQPNVRAVQAATFEWHAPSMRVIAKVRMERVGTREHETLGEMLVYERRKAATKALSDS